MPGQIVQPNAPPSLQSQLLAQVLQQMRTQPQTPVGATANLVAAALNTFGQQAAGQGGAGQWRDPASNISGNWFNSPLGKQIGSLFGLGQAAPGVPVSGQALLMNPATGFVTPASAGGAAS